MDFGQILVLTSGVGGIIAALWKVFNTVRVLERQLESVDNALRRQIELVENTLARRIEEVDNELDKQLLMVNGMKERIEHTRSRLLDEMREKKERIDYVESWLAKNTEFDQRCKS